MNDKAPLWLVKSPFREIALEVSETAPTKSAVWLNVIDLDEGTLSEAKGFIAPTIPVKEISPAVPEERVRFLAPFKVPPNVILAPEVLPAIVEICRLD